MNGLSNAGFYGRHIPRSIKLSKWKWKSLIFTLFLVKDVSFSSEIECGHPPEDMNSAVECAFLWRWQMLSLPDFSGSVWNGTDTLYCAFFPLHGKWRHRDSQKWFSTTWHPSLLHPRGSNVHWLLGLAICRWSKSWSLMKSCEDQKKMKSTHHILSSTCHFVPLFWSIFSSFSSSRHTQVQAFQYLKTKDAVPWCKQFPCAISCSGYFLKIAIKMHKSKSFSRLFQWRKRKKNTKSKCSLLKPKFLQLYVLETPRRLFSIPT